MTNLEENVVEIIADVLELEVDEVKLDSCVVADLGADSLDIVDLSFSLGKKLGIKMPQKTVMMHAEEMADADIQLVENETITAITAELLRAGPNKYTEEEIFEGQNLIDIYSNTKVCHWVNLCSAITEAGISGDALIQQGVEAVLKQHAVLS